MKVYEALANALAEEGVPALFGLMGDGNMKLISCWASDLGMPWYGTRHESAGIAMADGFARVSGQVGVCTVTQGPGLTNSLTALVTARKAHSPLLLLAGAVPEHQRGWPQDIDQERLFEAAGVPSVRIADPSTPLSDLTRAVQLARSSAGPVGVNLPVDVQERDWVAWKDEPHVPPASAPPPPAAEQLARAVEILAASRRPVVIAGRGAVVAAPQDQGTPGCAASLHSIGDRLGALMATTLRAKGLFDRHPFGIGLAGGLGTNLAVKLIGEADVVLVVGAAMNDFTTLRRTLVAESAKVVRIDADPSAPDANVPNQLLLTGDAAQLCAALAGALEQAGVTREGYRNATLRAELAAFRPEHEVAFARSPDGLDPRELTARLERLLPPDRLVVTDAGHFFGNPVSYLSVGDARSFVCGIDFGSIGLGIGMAMGASVARPGAPTVMMCGDGGLLMSLGDLDTAVRYHLPLLVVVMNDAAYGSELQIMRIWGLPDHLAAFPRTDFAALAQSFGWRAATVCSLEDLDTAMARLDPRDGPVLLDCAVTREVRAAWLDEAFSR